MEEEDEGPADPAGARIACIQAAAEADGAVCSIVLAEDGETFESYVFRHASLDRPGDLLYRAPGWFKSLLLEPDGTRLVVDTDGLLHSDRGGRWTQEPVSGGVGLTDLKLIEGLLHATADDGAVWRRAAAGWRSLGRARTTLYAIDGPSASELYAAGDDGLAVWLDGGRIRDLALPTDAPLTSVLTAPSGQTYIAGESGALFVGRGAIWHAVPDWDANVYGLAWYRDRLVLAAAERGVWTFDGSAFAALRDDLDAASVTANGSYLCVAVDDQVWRFDGSIWRHRTFTF